MKFIIDRFENEFTFLEDEQKIIRIASKNLPKGVREGDVIILEHNIYTVDQERTTKRKQNIKKLINELWN